MDIFGIPVELVATGIPVVLGAFKTFKFVKEGEEGIKLRFGKAVRFKNGEPKVYKPGFAVLFPFAESLVTRHVRVQTLELKKQQITIKNGLSYVVDAVLRFRVILIYNALFVVDDLDTVMTNVSMSTLRAVISPSSNAEAMTDTDNLGHMLTEAVKAHQQEWGVEIDEFSITSCVPTSESQQIVNAGAGAQVRWDSLINVMGGRETLLANPQLAASLIGIPVAVSLGQVDYPVEPVRKDTKTKDRFEVSLNKDE